MIFTRNKFIFIVLACAVLVGIFYAGPQALIWKYLTDNGQPYVSIQMTHRGDINQTYMPKAREVYDGHFPPVDFHLSDTAGLSTLFPVLPPLIFSPFLLVTGGSINAAMFTADFILPALIFLLFYLLGWVVVKNKLWALFLGFIGTLTPLAVHLPYTFRSLDNFLNIAVKNFYPLVNTKMDKLFLDRIDDPLLTYLIFIPAIISLIYFWQRPTVKKGILAGILTGLLAYTYFHYWVYMMVVAGILFMVVLVRRRLDRNKLKPFLVLLGVIILILIPYFINYLQFNNMVSAKDYLARVEIEQGRFLRLTVPFSVVFDYIFYIILAGLVYWLFYKKDDKNRARLYWSFIGAMFVVWNIQLVTGFVPHPDHFWRTISPIILVILFDIAYQLSRRLKVRYVAAGLIVLMALLGVKKTANLIHFINPEPRFVEAGVFKSYNFDKDIVDSWQWIEQNLPPEPKIISDSLVTSMYLLSYTSARPYLMTGLNTVVLNKEIARRFLAANKLFGVSSGILQDRLKASPLSSPEEWEQGDRHSAFNKFKSAQHLFYNAFKQDTAEYRYTNKELVDNLLGEYKEIYLKWQDIDADYIYYGPWEREFSSPNFSQDSNLELMFKNQSVAIYKIIKD